MSTRNITVFTSIHKIILGFALALSVSTVAEAQSCEAAHDQATARCAMEALAANEAADLALRECLDNILPFQIIARLQCINDATDNKELAFVIYNNCILIADNSLTSCVARRKVAPPVVSN